MAAYVIATYDIVDQKGYEDYVPGVLPLLNKHGAEIIAADFDAKILEGDRRSVYLVLRFETEEAALEWYYDPEYEPVRKIRLASSANGNMAIAREFVPS